SISELLNAVNAAESAQRGYLLTGDDAVLEPYRTLRRTTAERLAKLPTLWRDTPRQLARLEELTPVLMRRLDIIDRTLALASQGQHVAAVDAMRRQGVPLM